MQMLCLAHAEYGWITNAIFVFDQFEDGVSVVWLNTIVQFENVSRKYEA